jgi:phosphonate transport system substrate-binding protein
MGRSLAVFSFLLAAACGGDAGTRPLVLGFLPSQQADSVLPDAERLGAFLSERIGRPVEVIVPSAYEPLIEGLRFDRVQIAFLDGGPGWIAHKRTGAEVILAEVNQGETFYWADAFTAKGSGITSLEDVVGKRVAFTSRTGSSGFLMPIGTMIAEGLVPVDGDGLDALETALQRSFARTIDAGGYQQALQALLDGRADVAFGAHDAPERFLTPGQQARIVAFHRFGRIPSHAVLVSSTLDPATVGLVRDAFMALNDSTNLPLLRAIYGVDGVRPATTGEHLGDFGRALEALPGMQRTLLDKAP